MVIHLEIWRDVVGFEPYYEVSNHGRVRSKERIYRNDSGRLITKHSKELKHFGDTYLRVGLKYPGDDKVYKMLVHRLVAEAFIPNPYNKPTVNHKNGCKQDNFDTNLEWATYEEQHAHAVKLGLRNMDSINKSVSRANSKPVVVTNTSTGRMFVFDSIGDAEKALGLGKGVGYYAVKHGNIIKGCTIKLLN